MSEYVVNYEIYVDGVATKWGNGTMTVDGVISAKKFNETFSKGALKDADLPASVDWRDVRILGVFKL